MSVTFTFLLLTTPDLIRLIQMNFFDLVEVKETGLKATQLQLWYELTHLIAITNNAINFFLYCLSGPAFRRELFAMIKC